jgi:hypothetical protein
MQIYDDLDELPAPPRKDISEDDELAARALGCVRIEEVDGEGYLNLYFADGTVVYAWNSLVHSDDAFNLQVQLGLNVITNIQERRSVAASGDRDRCTEYWNQHADARAATRRAVTRAVAQRASPNTGLGHQLK